MASLIINLTFCSLPNQVCIAAAAQYYSIANLHLNTWTTSSDRSDETFSDLMVEWTKYFSFDFVHSSWISDGVIASMWSMSLVTRAWTYFHTVLEISSQKVTYSRRTISNEWTSSSWIGGGNISNTLNFSIFLMDCMVWYYRLLVLHHLLV